MFLMCNLFIQQLFTAFFLKKIKNFTHQSQKQFHCTAILLWEITTEFKDNKCTNTILSQNFRAPVLTDHFPEGFCFQVGCRFWANDIRLFKGIFSLNKLFLRLNFPLTNASISLVLIFVWSYAIYKTKLLFSDFNLQTYFF